MSRLRSSGPRQVLHTAIPATLRHAGHVHAAHELGAVQTLLITDTLFRVNDVAARRKYSSLVEEVEAGGGEVFVFSGATVLRIVTPYHLLS